MKEDYVIKIEGTQRNGEDESTVSLSTRGSYLYKNGKYYIVYKESEATGFDGSVTTLKVEDDKRVSMLRHGKAPSQMIIEAGQRHTSHYNTGEGSLMLGISAHSIQNKLTPQGGELNFSYALDVNAVDISTNHIKITVREV